VRRLRIALERVGAAGVTGVGFLLFCVPFHFSAVAPAQRELAARTAQLERSRARPAARPASAGDTAQQLARFHAAFPAVERLPDEVASLYAHAKASGLALLKVEYRLESGGGALAAYQVTLPVRGSYAQLRNFVGRVLAHMPTTSVDALRFERKKSSDAHLEAQVRLTIHLRSVDEGRGT
jgi:hypothetical protein